MGYEREPSARSQALALIKTRDEMEVQMESLISVLNVPNGPGTSGTLVDAEGFPRADIDIPAVLDQRRRLNMLRTDHKELTGKIEKLLHEALAAPPDGDVVEEPRESTASSAATPSAPADRTSASGSTAVPAAQRAPQPVRPPFSLIDEISDHSPAKEAGLLVGDKIISFGPVSLRSLGNPEAAIHALPGLLREHEGREIIISISRALTESENDREAVEIKLTPRRWAGQGLLGCHIVAVPVEEDSFVPEVATAVASRGHGMFSS